MKFSVASAICPAFANRIVFVNRLVFATHEGFSESEGVRNPHCVAISIFLSDFATSLFVVSRVLPNEGW